MAQLARGLLWPFTLTFLAIGMLCFVSRVKIVMVKNFNENVEL